MDPGSGDQGEIVYSGLPGNTFGMATMVDMSEASKQKSEDTGHLWQNGQDQDTVLRVWACLTGGHIGTFTVSFGLILLILFSFLMALFLTGRLFVY